MTDTITLRLTKKKHSPWGLFTDTDPPQQILWLTEEKMEGDIHRRFLTSGDIDRIRYAERCGIISVEGLENNIPAIAPESPIKGLDISPEQAQQVLDMAALLQGTEPVKYEDLTPVKIQGEMIQKEQEETNLMNLPSQKEGSASASQVAESLDEVMSQTISGTAVVEEGESFPTIDTKLSLQQEAQSQKVDEAFFQEMQDVQAKAAQKTFVEEKEEENALRQARIVDKYNTLLEKKENNPFIIQTLDQPANKVRRAIKILARGRVPLEMFKTMLKLEEKGRRRKTVLKEIRRIIEDRVANMTEDPGSVGSSSLDETYGDLIEEDEEGGVEVHYEPLPFDDEEIEVPAE
jgi:hypothetical protein